jgi:hypothetical protein
MRIASSIIGIALIPGALWAAPTSNKFDLECADTVKTTGDPVAPYVAHYRIDLAAKKWCEDECRTVKPIADLQSSYITLEGEPNSDFWHTIDREKGEDQIFSGSPQLGDMEHTSGQCTKRPFSGFPTFETKF